MRAAILLLLTLLCGCGPDERPLLICPESVAGSSGTWSGLRDLLFKADGSYWIADESGKPAQLYRYRHDYIPIIEPRTMPLEHSETNHAHISTPIIVRRSRYGLVLHLFRSNRVDHLPLAKTRIYPRDDFDIVRVQ